MTSPIALTATPMLHCLRRQVYAIAPQEAMPASYCNSYAHDPGNSQPLSTPATAPAPTTATPAGIPARQLFTLAIIAAIFSSIDRHAGYNDRLATNTATPTAATLGTVINTSENRRYIHTQARQRQFMYQRQLHKQH